MRLVDIVETWAHEKGLWHDKINKNLLGTEHDYINLGKTVEGFKYMTLWDTGRVRADLNYDIKLIPADPNFFAELLTLIETHTE